MPTSSSIANDQGNDTDDQQSPQSGVVETTKGEQVVDEEGNDDQKNQAMGLNSFNNIVHIILAACVCCCCVGIIALGIFCHKQRKKRFVHELDVRTMDANTKQGGDAPKKRTPAAMHEMVKTMSSLSSDDDEVVVQITMGQQSGTAHATANGRPQNTYFGYVQNVAAGNAMMMNDLIHEMTTPTEPVTRYHATFETNPNPSAQSANPRMQPRQEGFGSHGNGEDDCMSAEDDEVLQSVNDLRITAGNQATANDDDFGPNGNGQNEYMSVEDDEVLQTVNNMRVTAGNEAQTGVEDEDFGIVNDLDYQRQYIRTKR